MVDYAVVLTMQMYVSENREVEHEGAAIDSKLAIVSVTEQALALAMFGGQAVDVGLLTD